MTDSFADKAFSFINGHIGQLIVTMFFFYSGFGIYESVKAKGKQYILDFPKKRLLVTWISFAICVTAFLIEGILLGKSFELNQIVLSYIGWDSLGNSNWFMFVTFGMYILFFFAFSLGDNTYSINCLAFFSILVMLFTAFLYFFKESYWWNTTFCFPLGMWFSRYKKQTEEFLRKEKSAWFLLFAVVAVAFVVFYFVSFKVCNIFYLIAACFFCLIVVMLTMKIKIRNPALAFLGRHVFSIYMLQRLWYIPLSKIDMNRYVFLTISVVLTIISAVLFDLLMEKVKEKLIKNRF